LGQKPLRTLSLCLVAWSGRLAYRWNVATSFPTVRGSIGFIRYLLATRSVPVVWMQQYDPLGSWLASTLLAALPVAVLLGLLASGRAGAWQAALAGLATALAVAVGGFGMPADRAAAAVGYGMVFALFRIVWLILAAVYLYDLAVSAGQFDVMKASIARLSGDRRLQAILVAFSFGAFIEGAAGFGAPVAISAAFLVGLGFRPFQAALLCLIANTAPVAWGAIGTPIKTLGGVTGLEVEALSAMIGRILPVLSFIIPFWLVRTMVGWRETFAVWPALLTVGGTFAVVQYLWSNFVGVDLVDIASAVSSLLAGVVLLQVWRPRQVWRFPDDDRDLPLDSPSDSPIIDPPSVNPQVEGLSFGRIARAWMPFGLLSLTVLIWGVPAVKTQMDRTTSWHPEMPRLHLSIAKGEAVTGHRTPTAADYEKAIVDVVPISSTGTAVFVAALVSGLFLGVGLARQARIFGQTVIRLIPAMMAIFCMLALGFVTKYSGMDVVLGLAFTRTGPWLYPVFGTLLGWLGVALTGSDTSSNVLFGNLQKITAGKLGLNPVLMAAANSAGGVMGKMIDAQSIVVAAAATGEGGKEGDLLRAVIGHSIALALMVGAIVWLFAHVFPGGVPLAG
ncbi:MAG: L-lactate permease, partial [Isosphaeraceae bacterium]